MDAPGAEAAPVPVPDGRRRALARRRRISVALGVVIAGLLALGLLQPAGGSGQRLAPHFRLPRLGGGRPVTYPPGAGRPIGPVVLSFFASWCGPCHAELPTLARIARRESRLHAAVTFLGVDENDSDGLAFVRAAGVGFPVGDDTLSTVGVRFELDGIPNTVFVSADGRIEHVVSGAVSADQLDTWLRRLGVRTS